MDNKTEVGIVKSVKDFLVSLEGLPKIEINEIVRSEEGVEGFVNSLLSNHVEVLLLNSGGVQPNQIFYRTGKKLSITTSSNLLGRAINPLGVPVDGRGPIKLEPTDSLQEIDQPAPGIRDREFIAEQFETGITLIDTLVPIGKGQRELIVGDARSGKTSFLIDVLANQRMTGVICIYAVIGKPLTDVKKLLLTLNTIKAIDHTVVVAATSNDLPPLIHLAPKTAMTIAEYFQRQGRDILLILDDLGNHAKIYREIALLSEQSPGRESYPGDIFYQHAHILERAGKFNKSFGGGSITALPTIEINLNDLTTFIPTNLMAMTDGHLLFKAALSNQGRRPAVDLSLSVSRVGKQTQQRVQNLLSTRIRQVLALAEELETVSRFSFDLPQSTKTVLSQKELIEELIKQDPLTYISRPVQTALLALPFTKFLQEGNVNFVKENRALLTDILTQDGLLGQITKTSFDLKNDEALFQQLDTVANYLQGVISRQGKGTPQTTAAETGGKN